MRKAEKRVTLRWAAFVKARVGVSKSRANELIQMASVSRGVIVDRRFMIT
jgi:hypothetical protein